MSDILIKNCINFDGGKSDILIKNGIIKENTNNSNHLATLERKPDKNKSRNVLYFQIEKILLNIIKSILKN